jgi:hypothetical protein
VKKPCHAEGGGGGETTEESKTGGGRITMSRWFVCGPDLADRPNQTDNRPINIYPVAPCGITPQTVLKLNILRLVCSAVQYNARWKTQGPTPPYLFIGFSVSACTQQLAKPPTLVTPELRI